MCPAPWWLLQLLLLALLLLLLLLWKHNTDRRWRRLHLGIALLGKDYTLVAARSSTIRLDM